MHWQILLVLETMMQCHKIRQLLKAASGSLQTPQEKRHLLRWWVHSDANDRPVAPTFAPRSSVRPEGGFKYDAGTKLRLPFFPYSRHDGEGQSPY